MDNKKYEFKGSTVEDAVNAGLTELNLTKEDVEIEVLNRGGFLSKAHVSITVKEKEVEISEPKLAIAPEEGDNSEESFYNADKSHKFDAKHIEDAAEKCHNFVHTLTEMMDLSCEITTEVKDEEIFVNIEGSRTSIIIGHRGEVLDSIQYLALLAANKGHRNFVRVHVDTENYRKKREDTLVSLANRLARTVAKTGKATELEPMNPFERRIIHAALSDDKFVTTQSAGEGRFRHVIIKPTNSDYSDKNYGNNSEFKRNGPSKTKSFGYNNKKF